MGLQRQRSRVTKPASGARRLPPAAAAAVPPRVSPPCCPHHAARRPAARCRQPPWRVRRSGSTTLWCLEPQALPDDVWLSTWRPPAALAGAGRWRGAAAGGSRRWPPPWAAPPLPASSWLMSATRPRCRPWRGAGRGAGRRALDGCLLATRAPEAPCGGVPKSRSSPVTRPRVLPTPHHTPARSSTRVLLSTVGPFRLHGEPVVAAAVAAGAHYLDVCGEPGESPGVWGSPARLAGVQRSHRR